jgi:hypothetical protein
MIRRPVDGDDDRLGVGRRLDRADGALERTVRGRDRVAELGRRERVEVRPIARDAPVDRVTRVGLLERTRVLAGADTRVGADDLRRPAERERLVESACRVPRVREAAGMEDDRVALAGGEDRRLRTVGRRLAEAERARWAGWEPMLARAEGDASRRDGGRPTALASARQVAGLRVVGRVGWETGGGCQAGLAVGRWVRGTRRMTREGGRVGWAMPPGGHGGA